MPLSPEEQRKLDEIEQALRDGDPTLGSSVSHVRARRRGIVGRVVALCGSVVVLAGVVATQALLGAEVGVAFSPAGLLIGSMGMLAVAGWLFGLRRSPEPPHADRRSGRPGR